MQHPSRGNDILEISCAPLFGYQIIETMDPKKWEFPQEPHAERRKRLKPGANLSPERNLAQLRTDWTTLQERLEFQKRWVNDGQDDTSTWTS